MKLAVKGVGLALTPSIRRYVDEKLVRSAAKLLGRDPAWQAAALELELIRESRHHRKGTFWKAAANLELPGKRFRQSVEAEDIHAAVDDLEVVLKREITKYKERSRSRLLRGARRAKKDMRLARAARLYRTGRIREEGL